MNIRTIELESLYFFLIAALIGMTFAISTHRPPQHQTTITMPVMQSYQNPITSLEPSPREVATQLSPDGTMKISMTAITNTDLSRTYTFTISDETDNTKHTLYTVTIPSTDSLTIPFNTWSPDNVYVFLEHHTKDQINVLVFRSDGQLMTATDKYLNITDIYNMRQTGNTYDETTGWASNTLLIVNTKLSDGSKGPSYWVEIPSKAVIQLSTQF